MRKRWLFNWCFIGLFCLLKVAQGNDLILEQKHVSQGLWIFPSSEVFEDPSGELSFEQVRDGDHVFLSVAKGSLAPTDIQQGFTRSVFWLKVNLIDNTTENQWFIHGWGSLNETVDVYVRSGEAQKFSKMPVLSGYFNTVLRLTSAPGMKHTLFIRVQDIQTPVDLSFMLMSTKAMLWQATQSYPVYALVLGGLLILAIYNLFYFFYLRDVGFLALAVFIASFSLELGNHLGGWNYFSFTRHYLHYAGTGFGFIAMASLIVVFSHLLELKQNIPRGHVFFKVVFWGCLLLVLLAPFIYYGVAVISTLGLILITAAFVTFIRLYLQQYQFLKSMLLAIFIFFVSTIPALLMGIGVVNIHGPLVHLPMLGLLVGLVLMSLTQAEQVRTKTKQAERTLAANQAKDEFLTTMSHELRTPMNAVVGAGYLLSQTVLQVGQRELVLRLNNSSAHMLSLINDILDLAKADSHSLVLEKHPFKLNEVLESLDKLLCGAADAKGVKLILRNHFVPFRQELVGDVTRLKQVLLNLLNNAIKFTEQGHVRLTITPQQISANTAVLLFEVADTGIGIPKEKQKDIFQPFTQAEGSTTRRYGGSGLGLAISYKLVKFMGGALKLDSQLGKGSRFYFTVDIPLKGTVDWVEEDAKPAFSEADQLSGLRVMLVDDDEMNRFFGEKLLQACGVSVVTADSGEQALELLKREVLDLILLDVSMPGMNGYQVAQEIRHQEKLSDLAVVGLTAHAITGERERCLAAGMDDFLAKPFELSDLRKVLHKHSGKRLPSVSRSGTSTS